MPTPGNEEGVEPGRLFFSFLFFFFFHGQPFLQQVRLHCITARLVILGSDQPALPVIMLEQAMHGPEWRSRNPVHNFDSQRESPRLL